MSSKQFFSTFYPASSNEGIAGATVPTRMSPQQIEEIVNGAISPELIQEQIDSVTQAFQDAITELELAQAQLSQAQSQLDQLVQQANANFDTRLDDLDTGLDGVQQINATQQTQIDGKASQTSLNGVINRVGTAESQIGSLNTTIAGLDGKYALVSSYNTLLSEVQNARGGYGNLSGRFTAQQQAITDGLAGKASVSDLNSLAARVTSAEGVNTAQNSRLSTVESDLSGKASATDLSYLWATVDGQGSTISSHNSRLDTVGSNLSGKASASSLSNLSAVVGTRSRTFFQGTTPVGTTDSPLHVGDLWVHTGDGRKLYAWNGSQWTFADDQNIQGMIGAANSRLDTVEADLSGKASASSVSNLSAVVSGKSTTYRQASDPPNPNVGDILYKTSDNNRPFRYGGPGVGWVDIADKRVADLEGNVTTISGQIDTIQTVTADLQSGKASVESVTNATAVANGASANANSALSLAASADGKASALVTNQTDVNGVITGTYSYNNGVTTGFRVRSDLVEFVPSSNSGNRIEMSNGNIRVYRANNTLAFRAGVW